MMTLENESQTEDTILQLDGISFLMDSDSAPFLEEATIDYVEDLTRVGFVINNPMFSTGGCGSGGCGSGGCGGGGCGCGAGGGGCGSIDAKTIPQTKNQNHDKGRSYERPFLLSRHPVVRPSAEGT